MRRNKKQNMYLILGIIALVVTLGYAALTTTLKINGTLDVAKTSWDVHFENVSVTPTSVTATTAPTSDNTTTTEMEYAVDFTKPGDFYEFTVDMVNKGTISAMITSVSNKVYQANGTTERTLPEYLKSTITYDDGVQIAEKHKLDAGASEKIKVRVEFRKDIEISQLPSSGAETIKFKFATTFEQADNTAIDKPLPLWKPVYFAVGTPTTADTNRPSGKNVYVGMDAEGNKGVCINRSGTEYCFQAGNAAYEKQHLPQVLHGCSAHGTLECREDDFDCYVYDGGDVVCSYDGDTYEGCSVSSDGNVNCD